LPTESRDAAAWAVSSGDLREGSTLLSTGQNCFLRTADDIEQEGAPIDVEGATGSRLNETENWAVMLDLRAEEWHSKEQLRIVRLWYGVSTFMTQSSVACPVSQQRRHSPQSGGV